MPLMMLRVSKFGGGDEICLQLEMDGVPLGHIRMDGASAEGHIHNVATYRAQLTDQVAPELDPGARVHAFIDPMSRVDLSEEHERAVLGLRHPGLGWLGFLFPPDQARSIGTSLIALADELEGKGRSAASRGE